MSRIVQFSGKLSFILLIFLTVVLAVATFVEKVYDTKYAYSTFYGSAWFVACWFTLAIYGLIYIISQGLYKRIISFCLHIALFIILAGALFTHIGSVNGAIHLRENQPTHFFQNEEESTSAIPFALTLISFKIEYYKGTQSPSDYVSVVEINDPLNNKRFETQVSMNRILKYNGYRFYQSSFDDDMQGSILSINRDIYGIAVTYTGYYLLFITMLLMLIDKNGRFRKLLRSSILQKSTLVIVGVAMFAMQTSATPLLTTDGLTISSEQAKQFDEIWILYEGRVVPMQTFARNFTAKVYGKPSFKLYNATQVLVGWLLFPEKWRDIRFIDIDNAETQTVIGCKKASIADFFSTENQYKLAPYFKQIYQGDKQSALIKELSKLNEKIQLINIVTQGGLLTIFPQQTENLTQWYDSSSELPETLSQNEVLFIRDFFSNYRNAVAKENKTRADELLDSLANFQKQYAASALPSDTHRQVELAYNKLDIFSWLFKICLILGLLALIVFIVQTVRNVSHKRITTIMSILLAIVFIAQTVGLGLRAYIGGRLPLANGFETMLFVAWCALFIALCLRRYSLLIPSFGLLISGFALLVAHLGAMNPKITNLVPVLSSPLLSIHVSVIMFSYALVAFMTMNSLTTFLLLLFANKNNISSVSPTIKKLRVLSEIFLYPCAFFLAAGIFIGAIWANVSWGRYWGWDPKEVWALISFLITALPFHAKTLTWFRDTFFYNVYILLIFASVLMTYFGVNYFLGGMHSYAGNASISNSIILIAICLLVLTTVIVLAYCKYKLLIFAQHKNHLQ